MTSLYVCICKNDGRKIICIQIKKRTLQQCHNFTYIMIFNFCLILHNEKENANKFGRLWITYKTHVDIADVVPSSFHHTVPLLTSPCQNLPTSFPSVNLDSPSSWIFLYLSDYCYTYRTYNNWQHLAKSLPYIFTVKYHLGQAISLIVYDERILEDVIVSFCIYMWLNSIFKNSN